MTYGVKINTSQKLNLINSKTTWIFKFKPTMSFKQINIIQALSVGNLWTICETQNPVKLDGLRNYLYSGFFCKCTFSCNNVWGYVFPCTVMIPQSVFSVFRYFNVHFAVRTNFFICWITLPLSLEIRIFLQKLRTFADTHSTENVHLEVRQ